MDQDKIQAYREQQQAKAEQEQERRKHQELVGSVKQVAQFIKTDPKEVSVKNLPSIASPQDIKEIGQKLDDWTVSNFVSQNNILTELLDTLKSLSDKLQSVSGDNRQVVKDLTQSLVNALKALPQPSDKVSVTNQIDYSKKFDELKKVISSIEVTPNIQVDAPQVNIPKLDISPITKVLETQTRQLAEVKKIDLNDYKAQDLTGDDTFQYVGFVAPDGSWYIIENDMEGTTLRYKFGPKNYKSSWKDHANFSYKLLNEAIREVQA